MPTLHPASLLPKATSLIKETGQFILQEASKVPTLKIETKSLNSLVSYVDKEAEKMLVKGLLEILPNSVFLTEEATIKQKKGEYRWIIDPLDGTTNFLHQLPCFAVSVALQHHKETVMGFVYEPYRDELFHAIKGKGAFLNNQPISVSKTKKLKNSLLSTGFPYYDFDRQKNYLKVLKKFMKKTRGLRRWGSAATDLAYLAAGRYDAFFEYGLNSWDIAAGVLLVKEAGGTVTDFEGGADYLFGKDVLASNGFLQEEMLKNVRRI